jgi:glycosyltransferase involved in cell wall biosynthesis
LNKLRIAIVTTDKRDHDRDYTNPVPTFGTAPEALLQGFAAVPGSEIHVVSCAQKPLHAPAMLAPNIYFHSLVVPKIGWLRTGYQGCVRATRRKLREIQPDIVHGQGTERDCALDAVFSGFPNVLTIHGNMRLIAKVNGARPLTFEWLAARLESFTVPRTGGVICITEYTRRAVAGDAVPTWLLSNAVDEAFFGIVPADPSGLPIILCVGHICPRKNQNSLIRALDEVVTRIPIRLVCCGPADPSDPYGQEFMSLAAARPWIEHIPWATRSELREWLAKTTLLVLPSLEDNCPMAVLEAMAAGVPVVAGWVGGVPDLVEDRVTGLLCDPLDIASMASSMMALLDDPALRVSVSANARRQADDRFHPKVVASRHVEIYREVLARRR